MENRIRRLIFLTHKIIIKFIDNSILGDDKDEFLTMNRVYLNEMIGGSVLYFCMGERSLTVTVKTLFRNGHLLYKGTCTCAEAIKIDSMRQI